MKSESQPTSAAAGLMKERRQRKTISFFKITQQEIQKKEMKERKKERKKEKKTSWEKASLQ